MVFSDASWHYGYNSQTLAAHILSADEDEDFCRQQKAMNLCGEGLYVSFFWPSNNLQAVSGLEQCLKS